MVTPTLLVLPTPNVAGSGCQAGGAAPAAAGAASGTTAAPAATTMAATVVTTRARHRRTSVPTTTGFDPRGRYPVPREVPGRSRIARTARQRILSARGLDNLTNEMEAARAAMAGPDPVEVGRVLRQYSDMEDRFQVLGGYGAEAEASSMASGLALGERVLDQPLRTLS